MSEEQKARIVELARAAKRYLDRAAMHHDLRHMCKHASAERQCRSLAASASAEAFRIAQSA